MYVNLDMEQKTLQPFPSPQKDLHNFESVFIIMSSLVIVPRQSWSSQ